MSRVNGAGVLLGLLSVFALSVPASGAALIQRVLDKANHIVVGEVTYGTSVNEVNSFTLVPLYSLKGDLKPGVAIAVTYRVRLMAIKGTGEFSRQFGLWFLTREKTGEYALLAPRLQSPPLELAYYPLPQASRERPAVPMDSSLVDEVFMQLALAAESIGRGQTLWHVADGVLSCLDSSAGKGTRETLEQWSRSSSPNLVTLGLTGLVMTNDPIGLVRTRNVLSVIKEAEPQISSGFVGAVFAYRNPDPEGVRSLGEMATATDTGIGGLQRAAVHALRAIHTKESLPYLAKLLDSENPEARGEAVAGFTYFVNNWPIETPAAVAGMAFTRPVTDAPRRTEETDKHNSLGRFENAEDEQAAVGFWKGWWIVHQQELAAP